MAFAPIGVNVDLGIGQALKLIGETLSRRGQRKRDVVKDVIDDAEAAELVVKHLDKLFTDLLGELASPRVTENPTLLADAVDETRKFLFGRELLPVLDSRRSALRAAAEATGGAAKPIKNLQPVLKPLAAALDAYRENLDQAMPGTAPGLLGNVYQLAQSRTAGGAESPTQIREEAENVLRTHNFVLSERVYELSGELRQAARG